MIHRMVKLHLLLLISVISAIVHGAHIIPGNARVQDKSFEVPIKKLVSNSLGTSVYVSAGAQGIGAAYEFAIARLLPTESKWKPLVPQEVMLNDVYTNANPLFDARITHLSLLLCADKTEEVVAVTQADPSSIYCIHTAREPIQVKVAGQQKKITTEITSINGILDAHGNVTSGIVGISNPANIVFAAVKPQQISDNLPVKFGDYASGIIAFTWGNRDGKNTLMSLNLQTGMIDKSTLVGGNSNTYKTRAVAFNNTCECIKIGCAPIIEQDDVPMYWDDELERLYIGLNVTAGPGNGNGARSIVVGRLENSKIIFEKFAPDEVFGSGNDEIVGTGVSGGQASVHELKTMHTSTGLTYLIVRGGNGPATQTNNTIYALPLVQGHTDCHRKLNGTLASTDAQAEGIYGPYEDFYPYLGRSVKKQATTNAHMPKATDEAVVVGGGMALPGTVTSMLVRGDNVFVSIAESPIAGASGIYYSRALHGPDAKIHSWTLWQRAVGTTDQVFGFTYNQTNAETVFMTGTDAHTIDTIKRTVWLHGDKKGPNKQFDETIFNINKRFTEITNEIQNIVDFSSRTPALGNISMMAFLGAYKVVLMQTGESDDNHLVVPTDAALFNNVKQFENGGITSAIELKNNIRIIDIGGGDLKNIGPITNIEFARDGNNGSNGWLCVGGSRGFGILADDMGRGWTDDLNQGMLHSGFVQLRPGMKFKKIGDYTFVRKIISDDKFLYILTNKKLDRIELTPEKIKSGNLQPITIASTKMFGFGEYTGLFDLIVSEKFGLLATGRGLLRINNGYSIQTITNAQGGNAWVSVPIPEKAGASFTLISVSKTGRLQDVVRGFSIGQVYLVNGTYSRNISQLNRFIITGIEDKEVDNETVQPFPDCYRKGHLSYLTNFGSMLDLFFTDGALYLRACNESLKNASTYVWIIAAYTRVQTGSIGDAFGDQVAKLPVTINNDAIIRAIVRNSASGSLIIGGDFGIQVCE